MSFHIDDYQVRWKNFRCFRDTGWITIRPLTIILGANNAGKSSVIDPLLLLSQTVASPDRTTPLITKGPLVDLGTFQDVITDKQLDKDVSLSFKFHLHHNDGKVLELGKEPPGVIEVTFGSTEHPEEPILKKFALSDAFSRPMLTRTRRRGGQYDLKSTYGGPLRKVEKEFLAEETPTNFIFTPTTAIYAARSMPKEFSPSQHSGGFSQYLNAIGFAANDLIHIFSTLAYVGPLRDRPKRHYEVSGSIPASVGARGENMANMIRRQIKTIQTRLDKWVSSFELGSGLTVSDEHNGEFSLHFKQGRRRTNIADAGFGASQILPLIVQSLVAKKGSLTVAEQPEIHLNPRLQAILADLLVEMANREHRVIVETHSEHLLLRLRRLIARKEISHKQVALYFVERSGGESTIREIEVEPNGAILASEWPTGFFDESLRESFALIQDQNHMEKKRVVKKRVEKKRIES